MAVSPVSVNAAYQAAQRIAAAGDQSAVPAEGILHSFLTQCLERTIRFLGDLFDGLIFDLSHRIGLVDANLPKIFIDRHGRDIDVPAHARLQNLGREADDAWQIACHVDRRIPDPVQVTKLAHLLFAVAEDGLELREEIRVRFAAIEQGHFVTAPEC